MTGLFLALAFLATADPSRDPLDNWMQWRGPLATGEAPRAKPPVTWDATKNIKWKTPIPGKGSATPIVLGDDIFVLTAVDTERQADAKDIPKIDTRLERKTKAPTTYYQFLLLCLDRQTGKVRWQKVATEQVPHEGIHPTHSYAAGSPLTDGKRLYVSFGSRGIFCYDLAGKLLWKRELGQMYTRLGWGEGATPAVSGDTLIVNWDHDAGSFIVALDARTGDIRWKVERDELTSWATPLIVPTKDVTQVIVSATNKVRSYDLATGKVLWECGGQTVNVIPSPVLYGDHVICMSGYRGAAAMAIPLDGRGDLTKSAKLLWSYNKGTPYVPSPTLAQDRLWFTQRNEPVVTCLDAKTGKPLIEQQRLPNVQSFYGSPIAADGRIYFTSREGTTVVLANAPHFKVLSVNRLEEPVDASPVAVGKQLLLRGEKHLYCIEAE